MSAALRRARGSDPGAMVSILASAAGEVGATDVVVYLADFSQTTLEPIPDGATHADLPASETIAGSMAGRAFTDQRVVHAERDDVVRVWIPVVEASDRTGVVALSLPAADDATLAACEDLGLLAGYLIAAQARCTDLYNLYRRRKQLSLAASMQWDLLPPLVLKTDSVTVAGLVEPAYDVGGDCFDYAANGGTFDVAIMDAMGHGIRSALLSALAMGAYRHDRREARSLAAMHDSLATTMSTQHDDPAFVTGQLARIDTSTGELTWTNAGHPLPLLIRGGRVVGELRCKPSPPWGLGTGFGPPDVATEALEPGDAVLFFTDGVTESRTPDGDLFGVERLIDVVQSNASDLIHAEEIVRRLVGAVLAHQRADLMDDATVVLAQWAGPASP